MVAEDVADRVLGILAGARQREYFGEAVSQLDHALQTAQLAQEAGADDELVIAALLHDIGHLLDSADARRDGETGVINHDELGGVFLRGLGFSERVALLVWGHVPAKRYLVATNREYRSRLSPASERTLQLQGGPMTDLEARQFATHPLLRDCLRLRAWDEQAKIVGKPVNALDRYRALLVSHLSSQDLQPAES